MVTLVQAWPENYRGVKPEVDVQVSGGGSGVGIAGLIEGMVDLAPAAREMTIDCFWDWRAIPESRGIIRGSQSAGAVSASGRSDGIYRRS
jgi:hypothetical protein